jgi:DNA-binding winged helix-turn-helix (wHTH) protein
MLVPVPTAQKIRFGAFELDRQSGELFKHGTKLKLQGQLIAVLALLLERPGELITREELRKHLWPEDTFVDFEHSLNTHIKKLRQVFDDDAETPRYIETLPRRGYRFIAKVEAVTNGGEAIVEPTTAPVDNPDTSKEVPPSEPKPAAKAARWKYAILVALILAIAAGALYWFLRPRTPVVTAIRQLTHTGRQKLAYLVNDGKQFRGGRSEYSRT